VKAFETGVAPGLVLGVDAEIGVGASLLEQAAAKQETQTAAKPPETVCKNFALFMNFYFSNILNQNLFKKNIIPFVKFTISLNRKNFGYKIKINVND